MVAILIIAGLAVLLFVFKRNEGPMNSPGAMFEPTPEEGIYLKGSYLLSREGSEIGSAEFAFAKGVGSTIVVSGTYRFNMSATTDLVVEGKTGLVIEEGTQRPLSFNSRTITIPAEAGAGDTTKVDCRFHSGMADVTITRGGERTQNAVAVRPGFIVVENFGFPILAFTAMQFRALDLQTVQSTAFYPSSQEQPSVRMTVGGEARLAVPGDTVSCSRVILEISAHGRANPMTLWLDDEGVVRKIEIINQRLIADLKEFERIPLSETEEPVS